MDRKLINYLPPVLRDVTEFKAINNANEPEISLAWDGLDWVMANQFLDDADERGVSVWEQELRIRPKDTDSLTRRKARIKALWCSETPYTLRWLKQWLDSIYGPDRHQETVTDYTLNIWIDCVALQGGDVPAKEIVEVLRGLLPQNMWWQVIVSLTMRSTLCIGGTGAIHAAAGMRKAVDAPELSAVLRTGGTPAAHASLAVPGDDAPPSTTILRTGGVCTMISNLSSKGE